MKWHFNSFSSLSVSDFDCTEPLGMETGEIHSDQIAASSQYNQHWSPERSRLNSPENGWTPAEDSNKEWIQVPHELLSLSRIYDLSLMSNGTCPSERKDVLWYFLKNREAAKSQKKSLQNSPTLLISEFETFSK